MNNILIIDDSSEDYELARRAFLKIDPTSTIEWIDNGKSAFEKINRLNTIEDEERINLILLDIKMHEIDGFDILTAFKSGEFTRKIPIIMLSSSRMEKDIRRAFTLGANSYVQKPADYEEYNRIIRCISDYWFHVNSSIHVS